LLWDCVDTSSSFLIIIMVSSAKNQHSVFKGMHCMYDVFTVYGNICCFWMKANCYVPGEV
jgi:hypothetical protein